MFNFLFHKETGTVKSISNDLKFIIKLLNIKSINHEIYFTITATALVNHNLPNNKKNLIFREVFSKILDIDINNKKSWDYLFESYEQGINTSKTKVIGSYLDYTILVKKWLVDAKNNNDEFTNLILRLSTDVSEGNTKNLDILSLHLAKKSLIKTLKKANIDIKYV